MFWKKSDYSRSNSVYRKFIRTNGYLGISWFLYEVSLTKKPLFNIKNKISNIHDFLRKTSEASRFSVGATIPGSTKPKTKNTVFFLIWTHKSLFLVGRFSITNVAAKYKLFFIISSRLSQSIEKKNVYKSNTTIQYIEMSGRPQTRLSSITEP